MIFIKKGFREGCKKKRPCIHSETWVSVCVSASIDERQIEDEGWKKLVGRDNEPPEIVRGKREKTYTELGY